MMMMMMMMMIINFVLHSFHGEMINGETPMHKIKYVSNKQKLQLRTSLRKSLTKHLS